MTEDDLIARISELEVELDKKEHEIIENLDKIGQLEETIMRLEQLIPDDGKKKKKRSKDSKLAIELEEKEIQIRELKNKMGFLRKEKVQLQQKLEKFTRKQNMGTVIRIEEKKEPFENLIKELQSKINKQQFIIEKLEKENKKEVIEFLKNKSVSMVDYVITSGAVYKMEMFNTIGEFKESYFIDAVDEEICYRAKKIISLLIKLIMQYCCKHLVEPKNINYYTNM